MSALAGGASTTDDDEDNESDEDQEKDLLGWQGSSAVDAMDMADELDDLRAKIRLFEGFTEGAGKKVTLDSLGLSLSLSDWTKTVEQLHGA